MSTSSRASLPVYLCFALTASVAPRAAAAWEEPPRRATIYLNFDGGALEPGFNAALGESKCVKQPVDFPAFTRGEAAKATVVQLIQDKLAPYGVRVVTEAPPPELPYSMVMFGGKPSAIGEEPSAFAHGCGIDCGNEGARDTAFVFSEFEVGEHTLAFGGLSAIGQIVGLDYLEGEEHIMYSYINIGARNKAWSTECVPIDESVTFPKCGYVHEEFCPEGLQNDHAALLAYFGADSPDVEPPQVELLAPVDGAELPGSNVSIAVDVSDDHEGFGWKLVVYKDDVAVLAAPAFAGETSWDLGGLSPGVYRIEVAAIDHDRNVGSDAATIYVGVPAPAPGGSTGEDSETGDEVVTDGAAGSSESGDDGETGDDSDADTGGEQDGGDEGCGCRARGDGVGALLVLGALAWPRRRRRGAAVR